ncbi:hypothetical protein P170DRAFT_505716 [Aspergillus steynii IBT 23096]|uniref:UBA domain-containing protein Ucp14 n=1 Tax=Aspergillus steynii IBT 23096 TaxID=1392250 RepID=A0A2I2GQG4_9EURO|nr:uncharacterized protein P170DRAFT_505716 [Aspergillus steynii IBT 23096]PLB55094.1 hypothetical protein P170DRAFT_505716 [Aspergillus steynii IBT 23096]
MLTSGLTNAPITKLLLIYTIAASVLLSILDLKHLSSIHVSPHLRPYGQYWRILIWQVAGFANSTEALFAAMIVYHCRVVERAWGKRKMATFLLSTLPYTTILPPILLALLVRPLSLNTIGYLPSGPTASLFALLAQYHASIPHTVRYRISTSTSAPSSASDATSPAGKSLTVLLSDKSTTYLIGAQLALSQFPGMLLPAMLGWGVGLAWRMEILPGLSAGGAWRVPAWMVGERETRRIPRSNGRGGSSGEYEDLRRRLEGEAVAAAASGSASASGSGTAQRQRVRMADGD